MNSFLNAIIQKSSWKKATVFTILFAALYILINFSGVGVAGLMKITGGASILDFEFGYSYEKALNMLTALGTEGRVFYQTKILVIDFPFPFSYMLFYTGFIALLTKHITPKKLFGYLLFVPVLAMLFDWMENIGIIAMLNNYPALPNWAVSLACIMGILKTVFTIGSIIIIAGLFILFLYLKFRRHARPVRGR